MRQHPLLIFMGTRANWPNVRLTFGLPGSLIGWHRHVKVVQHDRDIDSIRGLRGPDEVWWHDWGATQVMRAHAAVYDFRPVTVEEMRDVIAKITAGS